MRNDSGSGSILGMVLIGTSVAALSFGTLISQIGLATMQVRTAVQLAAIGADQTRRGLSTGVPCERAKEILTLNMVFLEKCSIVSDETTVSGSKTLAGVLLTATAIATGS